MLTTHWLLVLHTSQPGCFVAWLQPHLYVPGLQAVGLATATEARATAAAAKNFMLPVATEG